MLKDTKHDEHHIFHAEQEYERIDTAIQVLNEQIICTGCIILLLRKSTLRCNKSLQLCELRGNVLQM